jgi:hypothetical protein
VGFLIQISRNSTVMEGDSSPAVPVAGLMAPPSALVDGWSTLLLDIMAARECQSCKPVDKMAALTELDMSEVVRGSFVVVMVGLRLNDEMESLPRARPCSTISVSLNDDVVTSHSLDREAG